MKDKKILLIEPYYGGSHKFFLDGLRQFVGGNFTLLSLPARKWKMRMQLAAPWFIEQIRSTAVKDRYFDIVLFSSFLDVAVFKAMAAGLQGWNERSRFFTYFHENQFCYPGFLEKKSNHQFTAINFTSALVSDAIAFNSEFNRSTFFRQVEKYIGKAVDMDLSESLEQLLSKGTVLYPGLDFREIDKSGRDRAAPGPKTIVWNHRWEHDKNPEEFFAALYRLQQENIDFRLCVLGQQFKNIPGCFDTAKQKLERKIVCFGYVEDRGTYYDYLRAGDIVVSTSWHEFFGMSVIEAVRAGCVPVLPNRLSYPELFDKRYLYEEGCLYDHLKQLLQSDLKLSLEQAKMMTEPYSWERLRDDYRRWLSSG